MRRAVLSCLFVAAWLAGCAEMREPPPLARVPPGLGLEAPDPVPAMVEAAARALRDNGRSLAGNPAATARAVGRLELVATEFRRDPRWAPMPSSVESELRSARLEWRSALGIRSGAAPEAVAAALGRAALALDAGETRAASGALDPALFETGGTVTLARLAAPGPLPLSRQASAAARDGVARLARLQLGGTTGALDPNRAPLGLGMPVHPMLR